MPITRIFDILEHYSGQTPLKDDAFCNRSQGQWHKLSVAEYIEQVDFLSIGLMSAGITTDDRIVTIVANTPEWNILDMAILQTGAIHVPLISSLSSTEYEFVLNHCNPKMVFAGSEELCRRLKPILMAMPAHTLLFCLQAQPEFKHWNVIIDAGKNLLVEKSDDLSAIKHQIKPTSVCTILYTSGSGTTPRGVMLTHQSILSNIQAAAPLLPVHAQHKALSFLPLAHIMERQINYLYQIKNVSIYYNSNINTLFEDIKEVAPHCFASVPRLLERLYDKFITHEAGLRGFKRAISHQAMALAANATEKHVFRWWEKLVLQLADQFVFNNWRSELGNNLQFILVGGAALHPKLSRVFHILGIPLIEGYGLTETSGVIALNHLKFAYYSYGTVGMLLPGWEIKLDDNDQLLVRGPGMMQGYYRDEMQYQMAGTPDGWFQTGDIATFTQGRFLKIIDRKQEVIKISRGEYLSPILIENKLKGSKYIDNAMVMGELQTGITALIVPNFENLHRKALELKILDKNDAQLAENVKIINFYHNIVNRLNRDLSSNLKVQHFLLVPDTWSTESGELSITLRLKRKFIKNKYQSHLTNTLQRINSINNHY